MGVSLSVTEICQYFLKFAAQNADIDSCTQPINRFSSGRSSPTG